MTMEAVCILKGEKPDWDTAKRILGDSNFMRSLEEFDKDNIPVSLRKSLESASSLALIYCMHLVWLIGAG